MLLYLLKTVFLNAQPKIRLDKLVKRNDFEDYKQVVIKVVKGLVNEIGFGRLSQNVDDLGNISYLIEVSENAPLGTEYHEKFHLFEKALFNSEQLRRLYNQWRKATGENLSDNEVSERLAEEFRYFSLERDLKDGQLKGSKEAGIFKRIFEFIENFIKDIAHLLSYNKNTVEGKGIKVLFDQLYTNKINDRAVTSYFTKIKAQSKFSLEELKAMSKAAMLRYYESLESEIKDFNHLDFITDSEYRKSVKEQYLALFDIDNAENKSTDTLLLEQLVYDFKTENNYINERLQNSNNKKAFIENFTEYFNQVNSELLEVTDDIDIDINDESSTGGKGENGFDFEPTSVNHIVKAPIIINQLLSTIAGEKNFLGFTEHINIDDVKVSLIKLLVEETTEREILDKLIDSDNDIFKIIASRIGEKSSNSSVNGLNRLTQKNQILNYFRKQILEFHQISVETTNKVVTIDVNRNERLNIESNNFNNVFKSLFPATTTAGLAVQLAPINKLPIAEFIDSFGLGINAHEFLNWSAVKNSRGKVTLSDIRSGLSSAFTHTKDLQDMIKNPSKFNRFKQLLDLVVEFKNENTPVQILVDNKPQYSIVERNFISKKLLELKKKHPTGFVEDGNIEEVEREEIQKVLRAKIKYGSSIKMEDEVQRVAEMTDKPSLIYHINSALNSNISSFINTGDKSSYFAFQDLSKMKGEPVIIEDYIEQFKSILKHEYNTFTKFKSKDEDVVLPKIENYFATTRSLIREDLERVVLSEDGSFKFNSFEDFYNHIKQDFVKGVERFRQTENKELYDLLVSNGLYSELEKKLSYIDEASMAKNGLYNAEVLVDALNLFFLESNILQAKYIIGDLGFYGLNLAKRVPAAMSVKKSGTYDLEQGKMFSDGGEFKLSKNSINFNEVDAEGELMFNALVMDDFYHYDEVLAAVHDAYKETTIGDGFAFEHIDALRFRENQEGTWTPEDELLYKADLEGKVDLETLTKWSIKKTQYFGDQLVEFGEGFSETMKVPTLYKFATLTISNTLVSGSKSPILRGIKELMENNNVPLAMFNSANKITRKEGYKLIDEEASIENTIERNQIPESTEKIVGVIEAIKTAKYLRLLEELKLSITFNSIDEFDKPEKSLTREELQKIRRILKNSEGTPISTEELIGIQEDIEKRRKKLENLITCMLGKTTGNCIELHTPHLKDVIDANILFKPRQDAIIRVLIVEYEELYTELRNFKNLVGADRGKYVNPLNYSKIREITKFFESKIDEQKRLIKAIVNTKVNSASSSSIKINNNPEEINKYKQKSYWKYYSTQQETSKKNKTEQTQGVQFTTLIYANILEGDGVLTDVNGNTLQAEDVIDEINELYVERVNAAREILYKRLDVGSSTKTASVDALLKEILNNLNQKEVSEVSKEEVVELLQNAKGLDTVLSSMSYEAVLNSIVNKLIIKPKKFGSPLTQSPNIGFTQMEFNQDESTISKQKGMIRLDDGSLLPELPFYQEGQDYLGVYLPNHFKHLGDIKKLDSRLLDLIGFRIPAQAENSIERIRIMGFLPASYGNMVVVPAQLTTKTGSNFEIDKLNTYYPNFHRNSKGEIIYTELLTDENSTVEERYNKYVRKNVKGTKSIIKESKESSEYVAYLKEVEKSYERILANSKITFKELVDSLEDAEIGNNIAFERLPSSIKQEYKEYNKVLNSRGILNLDKQQAFSDFTDIYIMNNNPQGALLDNLNLLKATYDIQTELLGGKLTEAKNEYTDNLGTFRVDKSSLTEKMNEDIIGAIADFYKLEDKENFGTRTILNQNSLEAIDNAIHEKYLTILDSKEYKKNMLKPNTDENIKKLAFEMKNSNTSDSADTEINFLTLRYHIKSRQGAQLGKMVLGQAALHTKHHITAQVADLYVNEAPPRFQDVAKVQTDKKITLLKTFKNNAGVSISDTFSELVNAFVDVLKEPYIKYSGITVNNAGTFFYMLRAGVSLDQVVYFFNHPAIRQYNKKVAELQFDTQGSTSTIHTIAINSLLHQINNDARSLQTLDTRLLKARAFAKSTKIESKSVDYSVIMEFDRLFRASSKLNEFMRVAKFDSAGIGSTFGETEALIYDLNKFERENNDYIGNWNNVFERNGKTTMLGAYKNIVNESTEYFTNLYTSDRYEGFTKARENTMMLVKTKNAGVVRNKYSSDFATYIVQNFGNFPKSLINPSNKTSTVGERILEITKNKSHKLANNVFLKALSVNLVEKTHKLLLFNSAAVTNLTADSLSKSFSELMHFDSTLGFDIIKVGILQDGFNTSPFSYLKNIPVEYKNWVTEIFYAVFNPDTIKDFDTKFKILNFRKVLIKQDYNKDNINENSYVVSTKDAKTGGYQVSINIGNKIYTINSDKSIGNNVDNMIYSGRSYLDYTDSIIGEANKTTNTDMERTLLDNMEAVKLLKCNI